MVNSTIALSTRSLPDGVSNSAGWSGLETERVCELVITGQGDSVELARVRLLVMLDEVVSYHFIHFIHLKTPISRISQSGLHAESCEIDQKLHAIVAGRKRNVLQSIMEETATNIYMPSPLQGLIGADFGQPSNATPNAPPNKLNPNVIWITGEFFGVQRARDMLFQVSMSKVSVQNSLHWTVDLP